MASIAGNQEQQTAAAAEHTVLDQDNCVDVAAATTATAAVVAPKRKVRMHPSDVRFVLSMKPEDIGGAEYLDEYAHKYTPEELEERKRLHEEVAAMLRDEDGELAARQADFASQLAEKGYVETDEPDWAKEEEFDKWATAQWETMTEQPWFKNHKLAESLNPYEGPGWVVRPFDAEEDEDEEYYEDEEDEYEYDDEEGEVDAEAEEEKEDEVGDEKEDANVQAHSDGEVAAPESSMIRLVL